MMKNIYNTGLSSFYPNDEVPEIEIIYSGGQLGTETASNNGNSFFDIAYVMSEATDEHKLYSEDLITPTSIKHKDYNLIFTLGFRY